MRKIWSAAIAVVGGIALGLGSAATFMDRAGFSAVPDNQNWFESQISGEADALPYALGHYLSSGVVPPPSSLRQFFRKTDDDGNTLRGDCVFFLEGAVSTARWWTIAATDADGVIQAANAVISAGQALNSADGRMTISFASSPVAGNWIKVPSGTYSISLTVHEPTDEEEKLSLPVVRRGRC